MENKLSINLPNSETINFFLNRREKNKALLSIDFYKHIWENHTTIIQEVKPNWKIKQIFFLFFLLLLLLYTKTSIESLF